MVNYGSLNYIPKQEPTNLEARTCFREICLGFLFASRLARTNLRCRKTEAMCPAVMWLRDDTAQLVSDSLSVVLLKLCQVDRLSRHWRRGCIESPCHGKAGWGDKPA